MKVTDEQVQELKLAHKDLFQITRKGNDYIFRYPTVKEWKEARRKDTTFSTNDKIVSTCLVFPTLRDLRDREKVDGFLVEVLGMRFMVNIMQDDDGDEGQETSLSDGSMGFKICRRGVTYNFRYPTRSEWKRISGLIATSASAAIDTLVGQCILDVSEQELIEIEKNDVSFMEQVGAPFLKVIINEWSDSEGKKI